MKNNKKNQGSTLLIVIAAVALITIFATVALSMSVANLQMKSIENKSKRNFYTAESALEELKAGLAVNLSGIVEKSYLMTLTSFSDASKENMDLQFKKSVVESCVRKYATSDSIVDSISTVEGKATYNTELLKSLLGKTKTNTKISAENGGILEWVLIPADSKRQFLCFHDVIIQYTSEEGYISRLQVDLKVAIPEVRLDTIGNLPNFAEYGVITDSGLTTNRKAAVMGNVFAGSKGILADGITGNLAIHANQVITKESICSKEGGKITLDSLIKGRPLEIWAKNMETVGSKVTDQNKGRLQADGKLYIADDTTLNAKNSTVEYSGSYYGFGHKTSPEESSGLLVNRENCTLDLSKLTNLFVAGRAYIEPADIVSSSKDYVLTGESIAIKASQSAYRLPSACIRVSNSGVGVEEISNPMPVATYNKIIAQSGTLDVNTSYRLPFNGKQLKTYVKGEVPYLAIFDKVGASTYVYLYPNFKDGKAASEYMQAVAANEQIMQSLKDRMKEYDSKILLPAAMDTKGSAIRTAGNVFGECSGKTTMYSNTMNGQLSDEIINEADNLSAMYKAYCTKLLPVVTHEESAYNTMYEALLIDSSNQEENPGFMQLLAGTAKYQEVDPTYGGFLLIDGDVTIDSTVDTNIHLVIATGNVTVARDFNGLIIAKGDVELSDGVTVKADQSAIYGLLQNTKVKSIFRDYHGLGNGLVTKENEPLDMAKLIQVENWKKE